MNSFNRENRYIVIKHSDLDKLYKDPTKYATTFGHALTLITPYLPKRQFLVIESDWPEYEPAWQMIERRMSRAAPVVERQPVAIVDEGEDGLFIDFIYGEDGNPLRRGDILYTDPPELTELQAANKRLTETIQHMIDQTTPLTPDENDPMWSRRITIDELQATIASLKAACTKEFESVQLLDNENQTLKTTIARLTAENERIKTISDNYSALLMDANAEIERMKAGQREPVGFLYRDKAERIIFEPNGDPHIRDYMQVFASQPAPVSVVLPISIDVEDSPPYSPHTNGEYAYRDGWNACLDKIKDLNGIK